ncbi:MAG: pyruvate, water dikinase regulatory protein [Candidatus Eisenbacteria bacterium]
MNKVFVVSDGTGGTAQRALQAALTQFTGAQMDVQLRGSVRTSQQVLEIVEETSAEGGFIVHTLVSNELREAMLRAGRLHNVQTIDLMGPLLDRLSQQLAKSPAERPGLFQELNEEYFRRMETIEFAFRHDDGQRGEDLTHAEIVLVGVSRTFKTPLSVYLAFKGWFVANVPIVLDIDPPGMLWRLPKGRVVALTINADWLAALRRVRQKYLGQEAGEYADLQHVRREVIYALRVFERPPTWPVIDVTCKPIEEIASEVLALARHSGQG